MAWTEEELISNKCEKCNGSVECYKEGVENNIPRFFYDTCIECGWYS